MNGPAREGAVLGVVVGALQIVDRRRDGDVAAAGAGPEPGRQASSGSPSSARLTLPDEPRILNRRTCCTISGSRCSSPTRRRKVRCGSSARDYGFGTDLVAVVEHDSSSGALLHQQMGDRRIGSDLDTRGAGGAGDGLRDGAGASLGQSPGSERAVDLSHVVMQEDVGGAGRADAEEGSDDAGDRHRRDELLALEPLREEVDRTHRHHLDVGEEPLVSLAAELLAEASDAQRARADRATADRAPARRSAA